MLSASRAAYLGTVRYISLGDHLPDSSTTAGNEDDLRKVEYCLSELNSSGGKSQRTLSLTSNNLEACMMIVRCGFAAKCKNLQCSIPQERCKISAQVYQGQPVESEFH